MCRCPSTHVIAVDGWTVSAERVMPGRSEDNPSRAVVDAMIECVAAKSGIVGPRPAPDLRPWGVFMVDTLTIGEDGWAVHETLRAADRRSVAVLERVEAVGADADPGSFPDDGLVHLDLHTDNVLIEDGTITGIIDWEGVCAVTTGSTSSCSCRPRRHGQPIWDVSTPPLRAMGAAVYVAHLAEVHRLGDPAPPRGRATPARPPERVLDRYEA